MSTTQDYQTTFKPNLACIFLPAIANWNINVCPWTACSYWVARAIIYIVCNLIILFEFGYHRAENEVLEAYEEEIEGVNVKASENTKDMIKFLGMKDPGFKRSNSMSPSHTP